jgi:hypothetical protein
MAGDQWSREAVAWLAQHPDGTHEQCLEAGHCEGRTYHAFRMKRDDVAKQRLTIRDLNTLQLSTRHDSPEQRAAYFKAVEDAAMLRARNQTASCFRATGTAARTAWTTRGSTPTWRCSVQRLGCISSELGITTRG